MAILDEIQRLVPGIRHFARESSGRQRASTHRWCSAVRARRGNPESDRAVERQPVYLGHVGSLLTRLNSVMESQQPEPAEFAAD